MTSDFNSPDMPQEQFDIGPLSWVMGEVRESVNHAGKMLQDGLAQDAESRSTALLHAKSYLHQAHGALQIVDIDGVSLVTETIEDILDRLQSQQLAMTQANVDVITEAFQAVLRYLEDLLAGMPHQPVRLFPYYRALLEVKGADRIHPADLFFPSLVAQEQIPELAVNKQPAVLNYTAIRQRLEKLLLGVLTAKEPAQLQLAAKNIQDLVHEVEAAQSNSQAKAFWVVLRAFVEGVANGSIPGHQYVKQIFGRINLQIRRLAEGSSSIPERLLRDALFFLAQVEHPSEFITRVRRAYQLETQVPADYEQKTYGLIAPGELSNTKEHLAAAKNLWGRIANGEHGLAEKFSQKMLALAESGQTLNNPPLTKLLRELSGIARHAAHSEGASKLGLELATSLLFVENALEQIARLPAHFAERADEITARLLGLVSGEAPLAEAAWMGEISREAQQKQTMSVLVAEMQSSLRHVEKALDEYFRDPKQLQQIQDIPASLHQVGGALAILDYDDALQAVNHTQALVKSFLEPEATQENTPEQLALQQNVAQNVGALSFFIETLQSQPETIKKKFSFDPVAKVLRSNLLETQASKELLPTTTVIAENDAVPQTAEQELLQKQQESVRLASALAESPDDQGLRDQLKHALESERSVANLLDDSAAKQRVNSAIDLLRQTEQAVKAGQAPEPVAVNTTEVAAPQEVQTAPVIPEGDEAIDAELLEIFLGEADEVLGFVRETLPASERNPGNHEHLTSLRRSFHTLKGSSRMVGLNVFGEAGWAIEQVMNLWLSESRDGTPDLYALLHQAEQEMFAWVTELQQTGYSARTGKALIAAAEGLKASGKFHYEADEVQADKVTAQEITAAEIAPEAVPEIAPEAVPEPELLQATPQIEVLDSLPPATNDTAASLPLVEDISETVEIEIPGETISILAQTELPEEQTQQAYDTLDIAALPEAEASIEIIAEAPAVNEDIQNHVADHEELAVAAESKPVEALDLPLEQELPALHEEAAQLVPDLVLPDSDQVATVQEEVVAVPEVSAELLVAEAEPVSLLEEIPGLTSAAEHNDLAEPDGAADTIVSDDLAADASLGNDIELLDKLVVSETLSSSESEVLTDLASNDLQSEIEQQATDAGLELTSEIEPELVPSLDLATEGVIAADPDTEIELALPLELESAAIEPELLAEHTNPVETEPSPEPLAELALESLPELSSEIATELIPELEDAGLSLVSAEPASLDQLAEEEFDLEIKAELQSLEADQESNLAISELEVGITDSNLNVSAPETAILVEDVQVFARQSEDQTTTAVTTAPDAELATEIASDKATAQIIEFPDRHAQPSVDDNIKRIGHLEISLPLYGIYMAETDEIVRFLSQDFSEWRHEPQRPVTTHSIHATHTLAGSSATVGLKALQELAHTLEIVLQRLQRHPVALQIQEFDLLDLVLDSAKRMLQQFALSELASHDSLNCHRLEQLLAAVVERSSVGEDEEFITSTNEKLDPAALIDLTHKVENSIEENPATESPQAEENSAQVLPELPLSAEVQVELTDASQVPVPETSPEIAEPELIESPESVTVLDEIAPSLIEAAEPLANVTEEVALPGVNLSTPASELEGIRVSDELDADLLPVFIEEANDLLPMVGELLRNWQSAPNEQQIPQSIARLMHTIKGSARMAGAMRLGQHIHDMETRIESLMHGASAGRLPLIDDLLARHDMALQMFDRLQNPQADNNEAEAAELSAAQELDQYQENLVQAQSEGSDADLATAVVDTAQEQKSVVPELPSVMPVLNAFANRTVIPAKPAPVAPAASGPVPLVRVRADVLDRLVNQAGEVSISRSRLENEVTILRSSLNELTDNVNRLRDQLREVEIQAETQITSRMAHSADREFDPLEFDRFTRLQELTRMMAESVADVATVQSNLNRTIDGASTDLQVQARLTRELQQDLMRVRMIPFASISERLYRVTRQASKEVDKRVNLDIRGANVEMDRSVLEKMAGPFEHLLRNAIVHGIESREQRRGTGKAEVGELLIEVRQEGNEVVIVFRDDGQGLNLARIREKALAIGMITKDENPADAEIASMIFEAGFSTASEVTELAGRGVGMDVVRSEASSLGGRVEVASQPGLGAEFTIRLPLTLAVNQVVLVSSGGRTYAVPSVLVEQVQQLKANALANAYNEGAVMWQGQRINLYYLSYMLGQHDATPTAQQYTPIMIMKSAGERVALHVDDILGNREVVVKNIGPQLARMAGIAGASVLGSGEIVLILDPVPLAHRMEHEFARTHQNGADIVVDVGAVADLQQDQKTAMTTADPVPGLRTQHTVMVVDDSLTVRRVTQRLLTREGYQVILAKDGIDALEQLQSVKPDVMLVDIEMPRMDGFDLTRNVRSDGRTADIPIIMITSRTADKHRNYAKELGVNEYFGKPYREDDLLQAISHFISSQLVSA